MILFSAIRIWLALTAIALVGFAFGVPRSGAFVTSRRLPFDHRIAASEVHSVAFLGLRRSFHPGAGRQHTSADFVGRYVIVRGGIPEGGEIAFEQTAERPAFADRTARTIAWIALSDAGIVTPGALDAGDAVELCADDGKRCTPPLEVAAVVCGEDAKSCSAALWVRRQDRDQLAVPEKTKTLHVFVHPNGSS